MNETNDNTPNLNKEQPQTNNFNNVQQNDQPLNNFNNFNNGQQQNINHAGVGAEEGTKLLVISIIGLFCCVFIALYSFIKCNNYKQQAQTTRQLLNKNIEIAYYVSIAAMAIQIIAMLGGSGMVFG